MKIILHPPLSLNEIGKRSNNEDCIFPASDDNIKKVEHPLFIVCDGVGGLEKGEVASKIVCEVLSGYLMNRSPLLSEDINQAVVLAENKIHSFINENADSYGMATTFTLLVVHEEGVTIAHLGDSRVYHIRGGNILHKTFDHSLVNEMVANNIISEVEAMNHPKRNVVTKVVMAGKEHIDPDVTVVRDVEEGDYFFLCTDGILESFSSFDLTLLLNNSKLSNEQKIATIREKCQQNSKDNFSAYLLQVKSVEKSKTVAKINNAVWGNTQLTMYVLAGTLLLVLGFFLFTRGGQSAPPPEENLGTSEQTNIENALKILDSIEVADIEEPSIDTNEIQEVVLSNVPVDKKEINANKITQKKEVLVPRGPKPTKPVPTQAVPKKEVLDTVKNKTPDLIIKAKDTLKTETQDSVKIILPVVREDSLNNQDSLKIKQPDQN